MLVQTAVVGMVLITAASNYLVEIPINDWLTWGTLTYPFTFFITEVTNCFRGPKTARKVVYIGFLVAVILAFVWMNKRIALASSLAFITGQLLDISVFNRLRRGSWWLAPIFSSVMASATDTGIFFSCAFIGTDVSWITLALGDFAVKLGLDLTMLFPFRLVLWRNKPSSNPSSNWALMKSLISFKKSEVTQRI